MCMLALAMTWVRVGSGSEAPSDAAVDTAVQKGIEYLLSTQEKYQPDRGVGKLPDDQLADWQVREQQRLKELRGQDGPGVEWPYEGVYRVGRRIPAGYRVGGSAIGK